MLRIAHLGTKGLPAMGGTERVVEAVGTRHAANHHVTVYGSRLVCRTGAYRGMRVEALPTSPGKRLGPVLSDLSAAAHCLVRRRFDVVHLHGSENSFILPALRLRYPVVATNHGDASRLDKWGAIAKMLMRLSEVASVRLATAPTAVAGTQAEQLSRRYGRQVAHVPNGVRATELVDREGANAILRELGVEPQQYWLFAAARVDPTKGCHTVLETHAAVGRVPLIVVGDLFHAPGYDQKLRGMAAGRPVHFVDRLDDKAVLMGLLAQTRLFVFPSTVEAMSMMLLEAVSLGAPTIASDIPENTTLLPEWFPTFRVGDAADLARAARDYLALEPKVVAELTREAADWVKERFDWDVIAAQYEQIYRDAIEKRDSSGWRRWRRRSRRLPALLPTEVRRRSHGQHREA
jgi:starch synthase